MAYWELVESCTDWISPPEVSSPFWSIPTRICAIVTRELFRMYQSHFGLERRPFAAVPQPEFYYPSAQIETARNVLGRCIERAAGAGLLVGHTGAGKTLVCQMLADKFGDQFRVAHLSSAHLCSRRALLQSILYELGLPYRGLDEGELRLSLIDHLASRRESLRGMLLLVDEAHTLAISLLEELRMITNVVRDGESRVRLVLAGTSQLEEKFANPRLEAFSQRLVARTYLEPLTREETIGYIQHQLSQSGGDADKIFDDDSFHAIYNATDGIPRLINQLCDHALLMANVGGYMQIDSAKIQEAWADLQQLPTPWGEVDSESLETGTGDVVEFGDFESEFDMETPATIAQPMEELTVDATELLGAIERDVEEAVEIGSQPSSGLKSELREPLPSFSDNDPVKEICKDPFAEQFEEVEIVDVQTPREDHNFPHRVSEALWEMAVEDLDGGSNPVQEEADAHDVVMAVHQPIETSNHDPVAVGYVNDLLTKQSEITVDNHTTLPADPQNILIESLVTNPVVENQELVSQDSGHSAIEADGQTAKLGEEKSLSRQQYKRFFSGLRQK